jgi:hypothetical protein
MWAKNLLNRVTYNFVKPLRFHRVEIIRTDTGPYISESASLKPRMVPQVVPEVVRMSNSYLTSFFQTSRTPPLLSGEIPILQAKF